MREKGTNRSHLLRSAGMVGGWTLASRVLGMARDILMAAFFGTSLHMSAFVVAFRIPNLFRRLFGEGALAAAFIPVFVETVEKQGREEAWATAGRVTTLLAATLLVIVLAVEAALFAVMRCLGPSGRWDEVLQLLQIMFPYMLFICLAALAMAMLQGLHRFALPALAPCVLNVLWIGAVLGGAMFSDLDMRAHIRIIAWSVVVAGFLQWGMQLPLLYRLGYRLRPPQGWFDRRVRRILTLMGPTALGMAVTQINVFIDGLLAVWIGSWAPAALFFSERLVYLPLGVFATALGTVLLPAFSAHAARRDHEEMRGIINHALRNLLFVTLPCAAGLFVLATPIVSMMFEWREFSAESTWLTARALRFYAPGLVVFSLSKVFVPAFYALQEPRTPVRVGLWTVGLNLGLNLLFVWTLPVYYKHAGLALATVLAMSCHVLVLAMLLQRRIGSPGWRDVASGTGKAAIACAAMMLVAREGHLRLSEGLLAVPVPDWAARIIAVGATLFLAAAAYVGTALLLRAREPFELLEAARGRGKP